MNHLHVLLATYRDPTAPPLPPPSPNAQARQAGARVEIEAQPATVAVGEFITLTGRPTNLGLPQYTLYLRNEPAVVIRYDGELIFQGFTGEVVNFISASASQNQVEFKLQATKPGMVEAIISVSGEVRLDTGGSMPVFSWSSASSPGITLTVVAQPLPDSPPEGRDQNWQVYLNKKYNYSLRYPATWELTDRLTYPEVEQSDTFAISSPGTDFLYLNIAVDDYPYSQDQRYCTKLAHCVNLYNQLRNSGPGWQIVKQEVIKQFETSVIHQTIDRPEDGWLHRQAFFFKNGHFYRLEFITQLDNAAQGGQIYEAIIATLSFDI